MNFIQTVFEKFELAWRLARFGAAFGDKTRLLFLPFVFPLAHRGVLFPRDRAYVVEIKAFGNRARISFASSVDIAAFREAFIEEEYSLPLSSEPNTIVDLGSHVGMSITYFALRFPYARIVGLEPDTDNFSRLAHQVAQFKNVFVENAAISSTNGTVRFYTSGVSSMSSSLMKRSANDRVCTVRAVTLETFLNNNGLPKVDLMKFDVEGAEETLFSDGRAIARIAAAVGEIHLKLIKISEKEFMSLLRGFSSVVVRRRSSSKLLIYATKVPADE